MAFGWARDSRGRASRRTRIAQCGMVAIGSLCIACSAHNVRGKMLEVQRDTLAQAAGAAILSKKPVIVDSVEYRGSNNGLRSRWPPYMVQVSVNVKNVGQRPVRLEVLGGNCAVRVQIYSASEVADAAHKLAAVRPVFDATELGFQCYVRSLYLALASGQDTTLQSVSGPGVRLAPGRYDLVGIVTVVPSEDSLRRHGPTLVTVPAGQLGIPQPFD